MNKSKVKNKKKTNKTKTTKDLAPVVPDWIKRDEHRGDVARSIIKLFADQDIKISEVDRVFSWVKDLIGTIPLHVAWPGFERRYQEQIKENRDVSGLFE